MRKWRPPTVPASQEWNVIYYNFLLSFLRSTVKLYYVSLADDTPMVGHIGVGKTYRRVLQHFYWPGISRDVKQYCRNCQVCQSVGQRNQKHTVARSFKANTCGWGTIFPCYS